MFDYSYHDMDYSGKYSYTSNWYTSNYTATFDTNYKVKTHIYSATFGLKNLMATWAYRYQETTQLSDSERTLLNMTSNSQVKKQHFLYGLRWQPHERFAAGVYYNYVLDEAWRFVAQIYF